MASLAPAFGERGNEGEGARKVEDNPSPPSPLPAARGEGWKSCRVGLCASDSFFYAV
jgi:hypothetical protein